jgi:hypothetical protein
MIDEYRATRTANLNRGLDLALLNQTRDGITATIESVYRIFRDAEASAGIVEGDRMVRDRANAAFTALQGYPITWPAGISFRGMGG